VSVDYSKVLSPASYLRPKHWVPPGPWEGHAPFAAWLVDALRPRTLIELGTHYGFSLFAFAEAAKNLGIEIDLHAIDAWEADNPAGVFGEEPIVTVQRIAAEDYPNVHLHQGYFGDVAPQFPDGFADVIHIDGTHTYDEVRRDFDAYLPKASDRGVILMHDVYAWRKDFGVFQLWDELADRYPSHRFTHSWGLGVLLVGDRPDPKVAAFIDEANRHPQLVNDMYKSLAWHNEIGGVW
jgi:hypothetical protein